MMPLQDAYTSGDTTGTSRNNFPTLYYVNFIKTKEEELIRELQKEIQKLRHENLELKFQVYVGPKVELESNVNICSSCSGSLDNRRYPSAEIRRNSSSRGLDKDQSTNTDEYQVVMKVTKKEESSESSSDLRSRKEISRLEKELESARKLIEELKWVQIHCDDKMQVQELKLEELQKEMMELKSTELEIFTVQIPPIHCLSSRSTVVTPTEHTSGLNSNRRRRSSSASRSYLSERRSSLQSILPENYKDSVATLPPISTAFPVTFDPVTPSTTPTSSASTVPYKALLLKHHPTPKLKFIPHQPSHRHHTPSANSTHHTLPLKAPALLQTSSPSK